MENDSKSTLRYAFVAGNAGTAAIATNVDVSITDFEAIKVFVLAEKVEMIVVGPEDPLVKGIYDFFFKR
jgi:phosphoribosylamine--glycine ligase